MAMILWACYCKYATCIARQCLMSYITNICMMKYHIDNVGWKTWNENKKSQENHIRNHFLVACGHWISAWAQLCEPLQITDGVCSKWMKVISLTVTSINGLLWCQQLNVNNWIDLQIDPCIYRFYNNTETDVFDQSWIQCTEFVVMSWPRIKIFWWLSARLITDWSSINGLELPQSWTKRLILCEIDNYREWILLLTYWGWVMHMWQ